MFEEWQQATIADIAAKDGIAGGPFGSDLVRSDYTKTGVPVIRGGNLGALGRRFSVEGFVYVSEAKADALARNTAEPGDIVVTQRGTLGQVGIVPDIGVSRFVISQSQMRLRCDPQKAHPLFVYYWLVHPETVAYIEANAVAAGVPHINLGFFKGMRLPLPPLAEQVGIANVLGALDDKIELNRRRNETLEALARALFKSWFVDFDPVRAKMAGRSSDETDRATAALFSDSFESSEIGPIPRGWGCATLDTFVSLQRGTTYKSALLGTEGPVLLGLATIKRNGGFRSDSLRRYAGDSPQKLIVNAGELYVSLKDVTQSADLLGSVARVPRAIGAGRLTQDTVKLVFDKASIPVEYIYRLLLTDNYREYCRGRAIGTTNLALSRTDFLSYRCAVPPANTMSRLIAIIAELSERLELSGESQTLTNLRDALLAKLLSGELRVRDAERRVGKAV